MKLQTVFRWIYIALLVLLQVWVFNYVYLFKVATPFVYLFALLLFPVNTTKAQLTLVGALIGLVIDLFSGTPGMHMAAATAAGFLRNYMLMPFVEVESEAELEFPPSSKLHGRGVMLFILEWVLVHHIILFGLDAVKGFDFIYFLLRLSSSVALTYVCLVILQLLFLERKR